MSELFHLKTARIIDANGIADGATLTFYESGTLTPTPVYTTEDLSTAHPNPLPVASGAALPDIYLDSAVSYRVIVRNSAGETIDDVDPYLGISSLGVLFTPSGTGAVSRTVQEKLREVQVSPADFGAAGDGSTDDTSDLIAMLAAGPSKVTASHRVNGLEIQTTDPVILVNEGTIESTTVNQSGLYLNPQGAHMEGARVSGGNFRQAQSPDLGLGLDDDYSAFRAAGQKRLRVSDIDVSSSDVGFSVQFGAANIGDRNNYDIIGENIYGEDIRGMGMELFGITRGSFSGYFVGDDGSGGRAIFHGARLNAFDFAPNRNVDVSLYAENFENGASIQRYTTNCTVNVMAVDCTRGIHLHGTDEEAADPTLTLAALSRGNRFIVKAVDCDTAVYDGASGNRFTIDATGCANGIRAIAGTEVGFGVNNHYEGQLTDGLGRLAWISQTGATFDLMLGGRNTTDATYGLLVDGNKCRGSARASLCGIGARITGNQNTLVLIVHDCTSALQIAGDDNVIDGVIVGDVLIEATANNTILRAIVTGTVTDLGTNTVKINKRDTGWSAITGTAFKGTYATFAQTYGTGTSGPTLTTPPTQAELQAIANAVAATQNALLTSTRRQKAHDDLLRTTFGFIGT